MEYVNLFEDKDLTEKKITLTWNDDDNAIVFSDGEIATVDYDGEFQYRDEWFSTVDHTEADDLIKDLEKRFKRDRFEWIEESYITKDILYESKYILSPTQFLTESRVDYQVYHNTYSSAVDAALEYAKSRGYEVDTDDVWREISVGPKKPKDGATNSASIGLLKNGKLQRKALQVQIYGMGNKFELNAYIN